MIKYYGRILFFFSLTNVIGLYVIFDVLGHASEYLATYIWTHTVYQLIFILIGISVLSKKETSLHVKIMYITLVLPMICIGGILHSGLTTEEIAPFFAINSLFSIPVGISIKQIHLFIKDGKNE